MSNTTKKFRATFNNIVTTLDGDLIVSFKAEREDTDTVKNAMNTLFSTDKQLSIVVDIHRERRSFSANAYLWVLCGKIASVVNIPKNDVYKQLIRDYGVYEAWELPNDSVERFCALWDESNSGFIGWFAEPLTPSNDTTTVLLYKGSSSYDSKQMSTLIEGVIGEAKQLEIDTMTPDEVARLTSLWQQKGE